MLDSLADSFLQERIALQDPMGYLQRVQEVRQAELLRDPLLVSPPHTVKSQGLHHLLIWARLRFAFLVVVLRSVEALQSKCLYFQICDDNYFPTRSRASSIIGFLEALCIRLVL